MALTINSVTGHHDGTWGGSALGYTEDGFNIIITFRGEEVTFEEFMNNMIDMIIGGASVSVEFTLKEWKAAAVQGLIWPYSATFGTLDCTGGNFVAASATPFSKPLVLTAKACSNIGQESAGKVWTFHKTFLEPEVAKNINLNNDLRVIPIRMSCLLDNLATEPAEDYQYFSLA